MNYLLRPRVPSRGTAQPTQPPWFPIGIGWALAGLGAMISAETSTLAVEPIKQHTQGWVEALHAQEPVPTSPVDKAERARPSHTDEPTGLAHTLKEERIAPVRIHSFTASDHPLDSMDAFAVMGDIYTDTDRTEYGDEIMALLDQVKQIVRYAERSTVQLEAHCDDRQSSAYSMIIGEQRARSLAENLRMMDMDATRLRVVSYGQERPVCGQWTINCWEDNLRMQRVFRTLAFLDPHNGCFVRVTILDGEEFVRYLQKTPASAFLKKIHLAEPPGRIGDRRPRPLTH